MTHRTHLCAEGRLGDRLAVVSLFVPRGPPRRSRPPREVGDPIAVARPAITQPRPRRAGRCGGFGDRVDAAAPRSVIPRGRRRRGVGDRRRRVEQREDALGRRHRRLQDVELLGQVADGSEEALRVEHERHQRAELEAALQRPRPAEPDDGGDGEGPEDLDGGIEHRVEEDRCEVGVAAPPVDRVEPLVLARLAPEELHRRHPRDVLLQERVDARDPAPHLAVRLPGVVPEPLRHRRDEGQHGEGDDGEAPVHDEEHDGDAGQHEDVPEHRHHPRREQLVEGVDVGGHAGHQAADRVAVEERHVEALQVRVDLRPQVEDDALARHLQRVGLHRLQHVGQHEDAEQEQGEGGQAGGVARRDVGVYRDLGQVRRRELQQRQPQDGEERQPDAGAVGPHVAQQPAHQARVVGLAEDLVVRLDHPRSSACSINCLRCRPA